MIHRFHTPLTVTLLLACAVIVVRPVEAQRTLSESDIQVKADMEWPEVGAGGYFPVMLTIQNRGPDCALRVSLTVDQTTPGLGNVPQVIKRLNLAQNAKTRVTLMVPVVSIRDSAEVHIEKNGRRLESLSIPVTFASDIEMRSFVVIDTVAPNVSRMREYFNSLASSRTFGASVAIGQRSPDNLPDSWLAYSGVDAVFAEAESLLSIDEAARNELFRWVGTGGTLLVYDVDKITNGTRDIDQLCLPTNVLNNWINLDSGEIEIFKRNGNRITFSVTLNKCDFQFGRIVAIPNDPFEYGKIGAVTMRIPHARGAHRPISSDADPAWQQILDLGGVTENDWLKRYGFSPRGSSDDFLKFINNNIRKLPTWGFVTLITLFALIIGPLNYWFLRKRNKISQMIWTTPVIALGTSLLLFGWSSMANGTGSHVRMRSLSVLDQRNQTMVSHNRLAIFSGTTPRDGLRFEPNSAIYPVWQDENGFEKGSVDWTDAQVMEGSFHQGNTRSQFMVTTPRTERGRVQIEEVTDQVMTINNGLEWELKYFLIRDGQDRYFFGEKIDAGESAELRRATEKDFEAIRARIGDQKLKSPVRPRGRSSWSSSRSSIYGGRRYDPVAAASMGNSLTETLLIRFAQTLSMKNEKLPSGEELEMGIPGLTWLAVLGESPGLDIGLQDFRVSEELHVLLGLFE